MGGEGQVSGEGWQGMTLTLDGVWAAPRAGGWLVSPARDCQAGAVVSAPGAQR